MSLTVLKREFLKKMGSGLRELLKADEIGSDPDTDMEEFIKRHMLVNNDTGKYEFSESKFLSLWVYSILIYFLNSFIL